MHFIEDDQVKVLSQRAEGLWVNQSVGKRIKIRNQNLVGALIRQPDGVEEPSACGDGQPHLLNELATGIEEWRLEWHAEALTYPHDEVDQILKLICGQDDTRIHQQH